MSKQISLFIDESGDPEFYGHRKKLLVGAKGFQPLLILGMIETSDRKALHENIKSLRSSILSDSCLSNIYSVSQPDWFFHARSDHSEVRLKFFEMLNKLNPTNLQFHAIIGRKDLQTFNRKHNNNPAEFYFDLVSHLLQGKLHVEDQYTIYLANRAKTNLHQLTSAVERAIEYDVQKQRLSGKIIHYTCSIEPSKQMPELCVVDYFLWALQRYLLKGDFHFWEKVEFLAGNIVDLYGEQPNEYNGTTHLLRLDGLRPPLNL